MKSWGVLFLDLLVFGLSCWSFDYAIAQSEETNENKFRERKATDDTLGYPNLDGKLEVVVPSFVHYLEVLEGSDGDKLPGWPAFHQSTVHSSPLLYDIDKDGVREVVLATYNGEVLFFRVSGYMMSDKLDIPRLKVKKDWYVGLHPDPVDRSHPDVHDEQLVEEFLTDSISKNVTHSSEEVPHDSSKASNSVPEEAHHETLQSNVSMTDIQHHDLNASHVENLVKSKDSQPEADIKMPQETNSTLSNSGSDKVKDEEIGKNIARRLLEEKDSKGNEDIHAITVENNGGLEADADASFELLRENNELADEYNYDYDDYVDEAMWGDVEWTETQHEKLEDYVLIDARLMHSGHSRH